MSWSGAIGIWISFLTDSEKFAPTVYRAFVIEFELPSWFVLLWFILLVLVPFSGIAFNHFYSRVVGATAGVFTWLYLGAWTWYWTGQPNTAATTFLAFAIGNAWADYRLWSTYRRMSVT